MLTDELVVLDDIRIELYPNRLRVIGRTGAYELITRVDRIILPASEANRGLEDALVLRNGIMLQEDVFDAPEASTREGGDRSCWICWARGVKSS